MKISSGFTIVEMLVVVTIVAVLATAAIYNVDGFLDYQSVNQAQRKLTSAIQNVRSFAMQTSFDTRNTTLWKNGKPTRLAASIYIFKGWVVPEADAKGLTGSFADGSSRDDKFEYDLSYSVLIVTDQGFQTKYDNKAPERELLEAVAGLSSISDPDIRARVINLPEGTILRYASPTDSFDAGAQGAELPAVSYLTYDTFGMVVRTKHTDYTSAGFHGKECYLALTYKDLTEDPIFIDLRTGDRVKNIENIGNLNFTDFDK